MPSCPLALQPRLPALVDENERVAIDEGGERVERDGGGTSEGGRDDAGGVEAGGSGRGGSGAPPEQNPRRDPEAVRAKRVLKETFMSRSAQIA